MNKNVNTFKAVKVSNTLRYVLGFCALLVVGAVVLLASLPSNRSWLFGWFDSSSNVARKEAMNDDKIGDEAGLAGTAVVNENLSVATLSTADHLWGNIGAPVQLIIYEDFQCPFCAQFYDTVERAKAEYGSQLVIAVRHYPLSNHELALPAAQASECAGVQGKFWEMYHELFRQNKSATMTLDTIRAAAPAVKLDEAAYKDCLTNAADTAKILASKEAVKKLGVIGTPASFLNGEYLPGAVPYEDYTHPDGKAELGLRSMIEKKLKN